MNFTENFVWGAATAAYQIEGAAYEADKGKHIWDVACERKRFVFEQQTAEVGCDHYHKFREDVALMKEMGLKAYRFSICWPRLMPDGTGRISETGVRFYNALIDELLKAGIEPYVTLFHWEYPYALYLQGGWLNPKSPEWFEEYAANVAKLFSDKVKYFITVNEPQCFIGLGLRGGAHAPFERRSDEEVLRAWHNTLKASGLAVKALRAHAKRPIEVGVTVATAVKMPYTEKDKKAADYANFAFTEKTFFTNSFFTDPVVFGRYPEGMMEGFGVDLKYPESDMEIIKSNIDFIGLNIYSGEYVSTGSDGKIFTVKPGLNTAKTDMRWNVYPECLYYGPKAFYNRYKLPVYITENGVAVTEWRASDGTLNDTSRIQFIRDYLKQLNRGISEGVDVRGYFYWSLMDNFEWAEGFSKRFGLIYVDYDTRERVLKESARFYAKIIRTNGSCL